MNKLKVYISGPMSGIPHFNFPKFREVTSRLRREGYEVFSPAEQDENVYGNISCYNETGDTEIAKQLFGFNLREALAVDVSYICTCADIIVMLPGWENSKGAQAEWALARALGLEIRYE